MAGQGTWCRMSHPIRSATIPSGRCQCGHLAPVGEVITCTRPGCGCERHTGSPYGGHDPATPPGAESALAAFMDALDTARQALEAAANAEVDAELARDAAKRRWLLSDECQALRTVAERKAWAESRIEPEERAFRLAKATREAARAALDVLGKQMSAQQSINRSVSASYQGTGDRR
jgi:hypothetical protein